MIKKMFVRCRPEGTYLYEMQLVREENEDEGYGCRTMHQGPCFDCEYGCPDYCLERMDLRVLSLMRYRMFTKGLR